MKRLSGSWSVPRWHGSCVGQICTKHISCRQDLTMAGYRIYYVEMWSRLWSTRGVKTCTVRSQVESVYAPEWPTLKPTGRSIVWRTSIPKTRYLMLLPCEEGQKCCNNINSIILTLQHIISGYACMCMHIRRLDRAGTILRNNCWLHDLDV